jgi:hypothetical protein
MKISRRELRALIAEASIPRHRKYGYRDTRDYLSRAEPGTFRERINLPEPEVKISNNASNVLYAFKYSWREHGKTMEALEKMYGHVTGYSLNTGAVYFYDMETGKETEMNIHEMLK